MFFNCGLPIVLSPRFIVEGNARLQNDCCSLFGFCVSGDNTILGWLNIFVDDIGVCVHIQRSSSC